MAGSDWSRSTSQATSGRRSSQRTLPPVARSIAGQYSAGTLPRLRHMCGALSETPIAEASATTLPAHSIARSRGCMMVSSVAHGRECTTHTIVMQEHAQITPVSTFAQRLKEAREAAGFKSQQALARAAGVSAGAIGNWESGSRQQPRDLLGLAKALRVSPEWLSTGSRTHASALSSAGELAHSMSLSSLETVPSTTWEQLEMTTGTELPRTFRICIEDNSMEPRVKPGAWVHFNSRETARPGDGVLVRDRTGKVHFREYRTGRPGSWQAHAENSVYTPLESERDGLEVLAVLMAVEARWG